jgi:4-hydroxy-tetrahydrodipicolinate synthase
VPLVYGQGGNDTAALVRTIESTDFSGYDAPFGIVYYISKPSQRGIIAHYQRVSHASLKS